MMNPDDPENIRNRICVDFDETICSNSGHPDYNILEPKKGAREALESMQIMGKFVIIYTSRGRKHFWEVMNWLERYQIPFGCLDMENKPLAQTYIDDKGLRFHSWYQTMHDLAELEKQ
jgi:hypothetical protein